MTVIVEYRTGGKEENKNVECYWEDSHYLYLKFKESCKVKQRKYIRRNVKLNCIMEEYRETHREYFKMKSRDSYRKKCGLPPLKNKI